MMIPRTVRAPSNAPITKYRRTTGPTFVISSYSRIRRRQARRPMSSALDPELLADELLEPRRGGPRLVGVREAGLREIRLSPSLAVELWRDGPDEFRRVDRHLRAACEDELHVARRGRPVNPGRARLGGCRLRHRQHEPDALRDLRPQDRPRTFRGLDFLSGLRGRLLVRRPLRELAVLLPLRHHPLHGGDDVVEGHLEDLRNPREFVDLFPRRFERALAGDVLQADDAVLDPRRAEDLDQRDVARPRDVGAAARFDVPLRDLDDAQLAPGDGAALVEPEAER